MLAAVIVTFNRKNLLGENIRMLLKQTRPFDKFFIVDNCSTDGTPEYLAEQGWMEDPRFVYVKTHANIGGAGGFYTGTKAAFEAGADYIVLMDDDGKAADEFTFERLVREAEGLHAENPKLFVNSLVRQGDLLSFKMGNRYTVAEALADAKDGLLDGEANPFNGTLVSRELVAEIGYPNPDFFIKGDEVNYKQRAFAADARVVTVVDSDYIHPRPETNERAVLGRKVPFFVEAPWKEYYAARNFTYMYKQNGWYKAIAFELAVVTVRQAVSFISP
jgi:rhamnopyranosyl-N-acetylglucosaminyl-diphospho-decaprenol beta-1,3/1,4-galactofuranosyltransferase